LEHPVRTLRLGLAAAALLLLAAPGAAAALNAPRDYQAQFPFLSGLNGDRFTMASGAVSATLPAADGAFGFIGTRGAELTGLTRVCWTGALRQCADSAAGTLTISVDDGGSFGVHIPNGADASVNADHALALFTDLSSTGDLNSLRLGKSMLATLVEGRAELTSVPAIPASTLADPTSDRGGAIASVDGTTTITIADNGNERATVRGKADPVTFAGAPHLDPVRADLVVLPFQGGADAHFTTAGHDAAVTGLDLNRINALFQRLFNANEGTPTQANTINEGSFGPYKDATAALFGGASLSLPTNVTSKASAQAIAFARTPRLEVKAVPNGLSWTGKATLEIKDGHVAGAPKLLGWAYVSLPWWGWLLWLAGIGVWITRLVMKADKHNGRWDRLKWIGWIAGPIAMVLVWLLWDNEVHAVFGLSLLSGHLTSQMLLVMLGVEVVTFAFMSFAAIAPLRLLLKNGSMLLGQGTFMGLTGAVAALLGFLFGATLLRSALDLVVHNVLSSIS
jgi:hypothetical protein